MWIGPAWRWQVVLCLAMALFGLAAGARAAELLDRVLAVVSGDVILLSDVVSAREFGLVQAPAGGDAVRGVLAQLIDRALILTEVDRYAPVEPSTQAVDEELAVVKRRVGSAPAFAAALSRAGIDERHLRQTLRENLRIRAYLDQRFTMAQPSDADALRYYRDHPAPFTRDGRLQPFEAVRQEAAQALGLERRAAMLDDWVSGLRRRAEITDLYLSGR